MKKLIAWMILTAGLLLLVSCNQETKPGPIELPDDGLTSTPIVVPTCTPIEGPTQVVTPQPGPTPTKAVMPSVAVLSPEPSQEATITSEATGIPDITVTIAPTEVPEPSPTSAPTATKIPELSPAAELTVIPNPTPETDITPTVNPEVLVNEGWQKTESIDEEYIIVFPDVFRNSTVSRTDRDLILSYTSEEEAAEFVLSYHMQQNLLDLLEKIVSKGGTITEEAPEGGKISYLMLSDGKIYQGVLFETGYSSELLGTVFGEEEFIAGVMQAVLVYPEEAAEKYQTEQYSYYIIKNREDN